MCGAFFHCVDFLGVEQTLEWGTGMGFMATIVLTIYFWAKYLTRNKVWKSIF
jgi:Na+-translocating ferredoxin:NAD+ oxidoreductase RnfA subunit|tara:strand:+ start:99 stop:254 length:156 start_codon:yes stop_codon:yes gene_type:complete